ncbi:MAG: tRNA uridine-5-carboxymethylaminomethyl(34) synthesis GTPase MnmE [bacterium]
MFDDTIVAISTALGEGGIGIVRLSGPQAIAIAEEIFHGPERVSRFPSHTIHYGRIIDPLNKKSLDEVLLTVMRAPQTYTREDVVEINGHGGIIPLRSILELTLRLGARLAEPGEFTRRAFLNGRIDLSQAEAVIDLIRAQTEAGAKIALHHLEGDLFREVSSIREELISLLAEVEASIDFPEEDLDFLKESELSERIMTAQKRLIKLVETAKGGRIIREGLATVIVGRPNVGKSSLLNALLGEDRAIVTPIPGTTRDTIEEIINLKGIPLRIIDTAGLRPVGDMVEEEGLRRTKRSLQQADLILLVLDASTRLTLEDKEIISQVKGRKGIVVLNKSDCPRLIEVEELEKLLPNHRSTHISAIHRTGLDDLREAVARTVLGGEIVVGEGLMVSNLRHQQALASAARSLKEASRTVADRGSPELIALDLREAADQVALISGETVTEDILDRIFANFCIGK